MTMNLAVRPEQPASLLLGDREFPAQQRTEITSTLSFLVTNLAPGQYPIGLRVDGVDSFPGRAVSIPSHVSESLGQALAGGNPHA
ncbi:MAG: hypothetical protein WCA35_13080 [Kovacikia sp.]